MGRMKYLYLGKRYALEILIEVKTLCENTWIWCYEQIISQLIPFLLNSFPHCVPIINIKWWLFSTGNLYQCEVNTANYEQLRPWFRKRKADKSQFRKKSSLEGIPGLSKTSCSGKWHASVASEAMVLHCGRVCMWLPRKDLYSLQLLPAWSSYNLFSVSDHQQPVMWELKIKDACKLFSSVMAQLK